MSIDPRLDASPDFELSQALQAAIADFNKAFIHMMLTAARSQDPIAPFLLGMPQETLAAYQSTPSFNLLAAHRFGLPLATARFKDPSVVREIFRTGISQAQIIALLTQEMDVEPLFKNSPQAA
jgi:hypothetical protein